MASGTELAKAYIQIIPSANGIQGAIQKALQPESEQAGERAGKSIVSKIKSVIVAAGIGKVLAASFEQGGMLQQSIGGIETLYKHSAEKVKAYAKDAYKYSGVSANAYMENVTSFSAALIASLSGDTNKAAESANRAMNDMSDNANKFGTNIQSIQDAYQGFAKQNYTMLDNLKLGYGGTKEEMQRLLTDAEKLSNQKYDISSLNDVYSAVSVVQDSLGITGTTAKEAATTFQGSFSAMKASAQDFLANIAIGGDVKESLSNLFSTTSTFIFDNALPMGFNIISGLGSALVLGIPVLAQKGYELLDGLANGIVKGVPVMLPKALEFVKRFGDDLSKKAPDMINLGFSLLSKIVDGIMSAIPILISNVPEIISKFANIINDNFPTILLKGGEILLQIGQGLLNAVPTLIANIPQIIVAIYDGFMAFQWLNLGKDIVKFLGDGISFMFEFLGEKGSSLVQSLVEQVTTLPSKLFEFGKTGVSKLGEGISSLYSWITTKANSLVSWIFDAVGSLPQKMLDIGSNIVEGIWKGIKSAKDWLLSKISTFADSVVDGIKDFFGIHSPSTVMADEVGQFLPKGIAVGIKANSNEVYSELDRLSQAALNIASDSFKFSNVDMSNSDNNNKLYELLQLIINLLRVISNKNSDISITANEREIARLMRELGVVFE